jgi:Serine/threonine protein kinase
MVSSSQRALRRSRGRETKQRRPGRRGAVRLGARPPARHRGLRSRMSPLPDSNPALIPPPTPDWVGRVLPSGLRVLASLGETPDGTLYSATYPTGLQVVLLILRYRRDRVGEAAVLANIRERVLQAIELQHPNVAGVYATGETADGADYIVLESLVGEPMSEMLASGGSVSLPEAIDLCRQACAGLQAAHAHGIVHGKLSPGSIVLARASGGIFTVKLAGFRMTPSPSEENVKSGAPSRTRSTRAPNDSRVRRPTAGATCTAWERCFTIWLPAPRRAPARWRARSHKYCARYSPRPWPKRPSAGSSRCRSLPPPWSGAPRRSGDREGPEPAGAWRLVRPPRCWLPPGELRC